MQNFDKINPLNQEDRELLSDLKSTFDLGTQTIIVQDKDEKVDDLMDSMTEYNEDL